MVTIITLKYSNDLENKGECQALTSNNITDEFKTFVVEELESIREYGFSEPIINDGDSVTSFDWLGEDIAIEVEVDWREFDIFLLLVRLENGRLPQGYYVSDGRRCRYHIQKVIAKLKWEVDPVALKAVSPGSNSNKSQHNFSLDILKITLQQYKKVLFSCIDQLLKERVKIFN